jgi:hypothetical protein
MTSKRLSDMLVELMREEEPAWVRLYDIIHDYTEENVKQFIRMLENLRAIDRNTNPEIIDEMIRHIGFDIHRDILEINGSNIRKGFYQLSKYSEINNTPVYPKFISFLLNRGFQVQNLFSQDYVNFSPVPGKLNIDGGSWFSTSHVNLVVDGANLAEDLSINLGAGDLEYVRRRLDYDKLDEAQKVAIGNQLMALMSRELNPDTDDPEIVEALVDYRISELFYKFAPIEEVIKDIYIGLYSKTYLYVSMSAMFYPKDFARLETPGIERVELMVPNVVSASTEYNVYVKVFWDDTTVTTVIPNTLSDTAGLMTQTKPTTMFRDPQTGISQSTTVIATFMGTEISKNIVVLAYGIPIKPDSLVIKGASVLKPGASEKYELLGKIGNNTFTIQDTENIVWSLDSDQYAELDTSTIRAKRVIQDQNVLMQVLYRAFDGAELSANKQILIVENLVSPIPVEIQPAYTLVTFDQYGNIATETTVTDFNQGNYYKVYADILFSDGSVVSEGFLVSSRVGMVEVNDQNIFLATAAGEDYKLVLDFIYVDKEETIKKTDYLNVEFPQIDLLSINIEGPDAVVEGRVARFIAIANWSNGQRSIINQADWYSTGGNVDNQDVLNVNIDSTGVAQMPLVTDNSVGLVRVSTQRYTDYQTITAQKFVTIQKNSRDLIGILTDVANTINEGQSVQMRFTARWSTDSRTEVLPTQVIVYGDDALTQILATATNVGNALQFQSFSQIEIENNPDFQFIDAETGLTHPMVMLKYTEGPDKVQGAIHIKAVYTNGNVQQYVVPVVAIPRIPKVERIESTIPLQLAEGNRYFFPTIGYYDNGETQEVNATWMGYDQMGETDNLPININNGQFPLDRIVEALIGIDRTTIEQMAIDNENLSVDQVRKLIQGEPIFANPSNRPVTGQTWPSKLGILMAQYDGVLLNRTLIQTRYIDEDETIQLVGKFYAQEVTQPLTVVNAPLQPHDRIDSYYISGPVEIEANESMMYSYALVMDYDDEGEEYPVSSDWEIDFYRDVDFDQQRELIRYLVEVDGKEDILPMSSDGSGTRVSVDMLSKIDMEEILPIASVVDIDGDGYLYPKMNVDARLILITNYDDGISTLTETLNIYMKKINSILRGLNMKITGPSGLISYDFKSLILDEPNQWAFDSLDGTLYYQLSVDLERTDNPVAGPPPGLVLWRAEPTGNGVSLDEATGRLYIAPQSDDSQVTLVASYTEEFRETEESAEVFTETVEARYVITVTASKALDIIELIGPNFAQDDTVFYPNVRVLRRDGSTAIAADVLSWEIVNGPKGLEVNDRFSFKIPRLDTDTTMTLKAIGREGQREITRDFVFNLLAGFVPEDLLVDANSPGYKDNSVINLVAMLKLRNNPTPIDVTSACIWMLDTKMTGLSIERNTGRLTTPYVEQDTYIDIRCVYVLGGFRQEKKFRILLQSSFSIYWTAGFNVINTTYFNLIWSENKFKRLTSVDTGKFTVLPNSTDYLYFACPKVLVPLRMAAVPSINPDVDWGNLEPGVDVVRTYLDGMTETWIIFKSVKRGFGQAEFSVAFKR